MCDRSVWIEATIKSTPSTRTESRVTYPTRAPGTYFLASATHWPTRPHMWTRIRVTRRTWAAAMWRHTTDLPWPQGRLKMQAGDREVAAHSAYLAAAAAWGGYACHSWPVNTASGRMGSPVTVSPGCTVATGKAAAA